MTIKQTREIPLGALFKGSQIRSSRDTKSGKQTGAAQQERVVEVATIERTTNGNYIPTCTNMMKFQLIAKLFFVLYMTCIDNEAAVSAARQKAAIRFIPRNSPKYRRAPTGKRVKNEFLVTVDTKGGKRFIIKILKHLLRGQGRIKKVYDKAIKGAVIANVKTPAMVRLLKHKKGTTRR